MARTKNDITNNTKSESHNHSIRLLHQNIAGLLNKLPLIEICLNEFNDSHKSIQILCFSETFVKANDEVNVCLNDFILATSYSRKKKNRGGVCILIKKNLEYKLIQLCHVMSIDKIFECCGIEIPLYNCIILCIYRTPRSNITIFFYKLELLLHKIWDRKKKKIILVGDLNINTLSTNTNATTLKELLANYNLTLKINTPTRQTSCIDHIITNITDAQGETCELHLSDHNTAQLLTFTTNRSSHKPVASHCFVYKRNYSPEYLEKFRECLLSLKWQDTYNEINPNAAFNNFHDIFCLFYKLNFPMRRLKIKYQTVPLKWITKGIKKSCLSKRYLKSKYHKNRTYENKLKYNKYAKILNKCINMSKKQTSNDFIYKAKNRCRATWKLIKNKPESRDSQYIEAINLDGIILDETDQIAAAFNNHFINTTNIDITNSKNYGMINIKNIGNTIFLEPCTTNEIAKIIASLNNTRAVGYDDLSTHIIKACADILSPIIAHLINTSFFAEEYPEKLKFSIVKPIYKNNNKQDLNNYRPVTLIPIISKVFERAMYNRIVSFLNKYNIISTEQNGFQRGKSTALACYQLTKSITENIDKRIPVTAMFFDMSKAFDFVKHDILLKKCEIYGIRGKALNWLQSYLSGRQQCVEILGVNKDNEVVKYKSNYMDNRFGVPQGSILGPLLFLLYINDLPAVIEHKCVLFADDISLIVTKDSKDELYEDKINAAVEPILNWLKENNLCVNITKTKYIRFTNNKIKNEAIKIFGRDNEIEEVTSTKFLGIILDKNCNWKNHIQDICKRLNCFAFALRNLRKTVGITAALLAYHGYVSSVLRYGIVIWGNSTDSNRAFVVQKKCIRSIFGAGPLESCRPLFRKHKLLTLVCLYILEMGVFVKKHPNLFVKANNTNYKIGKMSRDPSKLAIPMCSTTFCHNNSSVMAIKVFNTIPKEIRELPTKYFQNKLKVWLTEKCFYTIFEFMNLKISQKFELH